MVSLQTEVTPGGNTLLLVLFWLKYHNCNTASTSLSASRGLAKSSVARLFAARRLRGGIREQERDPAALIEPRRDVVREAVLTL